MARKKTQENGPRKNILTASLQARKASPGLDSSSAYRSLRSPTRFVFGPHTRCNPENSALRVDGATRVSRSDRAFCSDATMACVTLSTVGCRLPWIVGRVK